MNFIENKADKLDSIGPKGSENEQLSSAARLPRGARLTQCGACPAEDTNNPTTLARTQLSSQHQTLLTDDRPFNS
jgi:hypothetical protein